MPATYEPISTTTLSTTAATITFSSIPSTYTDLKLVLVHNGNGTAACVMRLNTDSILSTSASFTSLYGNGTSVISGRTASTGSFRITETTLSTNPKLVQVDLLSYAGNTNKAIFSSAATEANSGDESYTVFGSWTNTAAIDQIVLGWSGGQQFTVGTTATLYGIKAV